MAFPVICPACGKAFQLATEIYERKVAGKVVSIKCKQCQSGIRVDATKPGELKVLGATPAGGGDLSVGPKPPQAAPAASPATSPERPQAAAPIRMRQPTLIGMMSPAATPGKPLVQPVRPAAPATPALWAVDSGGEGDDKELNEEEIQREIKAGKITAQTLAWREGMGEWLEIEKIPELRAYLGASDDAKTARPPGEQAAKRDVPAHERNAGFQEEPDAEATMVYDRSQPNPALEAFAGIDQDTTARVPLGEIPIGQKVPADLETTERVFLGRAIPLEQPPPARVKFGQTAPLDPPAPPLPTAARGAPFAKTAPAAEPPPPPLPPPGRAAPPAHVARPAAPPDEPPPLPSAPAPAAHAFPSPPAQAPVLAAVPWGDPIPSAKPAAPAAPALPTAPYGPDPFAVAATTDLDFPSPKSKVPMFIAIGVGVVAVIGIIIAVASSGSSPAANIAAPTAVPKATATEEPKKETEPTNAPTQNDSQGSSTPAVQPQSPSGNFSDLFSKGAEKAKGSGSGTKGFDEAAAREALSGLLKTAAACKEPGGQTGQANATITFEPSGSVSGVTVGAPFAGTSTGTCIIGAFKRAKVAPFTGLPGTVSQTISLR